MELTANQQVLSRKYIAYRALTNMWFVGAVWLYFYRLFITDYQVGILDGFAFAIGLLAEVPSGALADKFGRDRLVKLGQILAGSGLIIQACGSDFIPFFIGQTVMMIGVSFASGADEALFFKQLNFARTSVEWRKLVTRGSQAALIGAMAATVLGGWLHLFNPRIPWFLTGIAFIAAALLIWTVKETRTTHVSQKFLIELKEYITDIKTGFSQFRLPKLWLYVPIIITVQGLFYATGFGLLRLILLDRFNFDPFLGSLAVATSSILTVGILFATHKYAESMNERHVLLLVSLSAVASLLLSLADIGLWGFVVIFTLYAGEHVLYPIMSEILNNHAPEKQRATVLSVASFLKALPYVALAPIIGYLSTNDQIEYFLLTWAFLICVALFLYLAIGKNNTKIKLDQVTP